MGLAKKAEAAVAEAPVQAEVDATKQESGTDAAIARLKNINVDGAVIGKRVSGTSTGQYKQTDYNSTTDAKSIRILRQGVYQHALISPALAGMQFSTPQEYLVLVKDVAEKVIQMIEE